MRVFNVELYNEYGERLRFRVPHLPYSLRSDTIFYNDSDNFTADEVKRALVEHDGYPDNITVYEDKR